MKAFRLLLPLMFLAACSSAGGSALLDVELRTLEGAPVTLDEASRGPTVVNFWASYCKPCIREMPALEKVAKDNPGVHFIGVNAMDEPERAREMVEQTGVSYDIWLDERGDAMVEADVRSLPGTLILLDGEVVFSKLGEISTDELEEAILGVTDARP